MSALYHIFGCTNRRTLTFFDILDKLGIATMTIAMIEGGIYFVSDCFQVS